MNDRCALISVIIPIYNVAPWLSEALDSLLAQTYTNWEAILVNDGSTDNSATIMEAYAAKDTRFKVIHQRNQGSGPARNAGMDIMRGDYFTFLDPDDVYFPWALETRLKAIQETGADIVEDCKFNFCDGHPLPEITPKHHLLKRTFIVPLNDLAAYHCQLYKTTTSPFILNGRDSWAAVWDKLYCKHFADLRFPNVTPGQDLAFNVICANEKGGTLAKIPTIGLAFRIRSSSASNVIAQDRQRSPIHFLDLQCNYSLNGLRLPLQLLYPTLFPLVDYATLLSSQGLLYWTKHTRSTKEQRHALRKRFWKYFRMGGLRMRHATPPVRILFLLFALTGWRRPLRYIPKIPGLTVYIPLNYNVLSDSK